GAAEAGIAELERRLAAAPFSAPEADDLRELGLGARELAVAERAGRLLRLGDGIVVSPRTPAQAMRILAGLDQPFTTSQARRTRVDAADRHHASRGRAVSSRPPRRRTAGSIRSHASKYCITIDVDMIVRAPSGRFRRWHG